MRVAMLDPSNFSPPYNDHLCTALASSGMEVVLYTRPMRPHEHYSCAGYAVQKHFYRWSERLYGRKPLQWASRYLKVLEHVVNLWTLCRLLKQSRPDVIHVQWCPLPIVDVLFLASLRRIAPIVLTVHNTKPFHGNPSSHIQGIGWLKSLRAFDRLIVHTEQSRQHLVAIGCQAEKISVIPHGALQSYSSPHASPVSRSDVPNAGGVKTVLFFGNVKPYKGVDVLLKAFSMIPVQSRMGAKVLIAGRSSIPRAEIEGWVKDLGIQDFVQLNLRFLPDEELSDLLRKAYMYVFPYKDIDASGALMLALYHGKPVIASRLGIFSELLVDGESALLAEVNDHAAFAAAMERVLMDPQLASRLGDGARQVAGTYQSWNDIAQLTLAVYQGLISPRAGKKEAE